MRLQLNLLISITLGINSLAAAEPPVADLPMAIHLALSVNETSAVAQARVARAQAVVDKTRASLWPQLTPSAHLTQNGTGDTPFAKENSRQLDVQANARWTLFDRATRTRIRSQSTQTAAQALRSRTDRRNLAFAVTDAYLTILAARAQVAAAERNLAVAQQAERDAETRNAAGIATAGSVLRARLTRANADTKLTDQQREATTTRLTLEYLINGTLATDLASAPEAELPAATGESLYEQARQRRDDLAARRLDQQAADLAGQASRQGLWPTLGLEAGATRNRWLTDRGAAFEGTSWSASGVIEMQLIDGGRRSAEAAEHQAEAREAGLLADQAERDLARSLGSITANLASRRIAVDQARVQLDEAIANAADVEQRVAVGQANPYEIADALSQRFSAESDLIAARLELARTAYQLRQELGLWPQSEP